MTLGNFENVGAVIRTCNNTLLKHDQACLEILSEENVTFWSQYEQCEGCKLLPTATVTSAKTLVLETFSPLRYAVTSGNGHICNGTYQLGEYGQYQLNLTETTTSSCPLHMVAEPDAAMLPILTGVIVLLAMATLWYIVKGIGKRMAAGRLLATYFNREDNELGSETRVLTTEVSGARGPARARLRSLDVFRGLCVALMIFVNAGGGGYTVFSHSVWDGLTLADVVFPWFAFAMGEALVLSLHARLRTALPRWSALGQVARRALLLALVGILLGSTDAAWGDVRLPGVLQRLAAMYLLVGAVECAAHTTTANITPGRSLFRDIAAGWKQWLVTLTLVAVQVCVSLLVPAPGCPRGYAGPGGLHRSALGEDLQNCTGGIAGHIDRVVFGPRHLYQRGTFRSLYQTTLPHDPEGLLGVLSGVLVVQAGAHAARIMLAYNHARARMMRWVLWALLLGLAGAALAGFGRGGAVPLNKNLWSSSFCLATAAGAMLLKALLYFAIDLKKKWGGRPLYYPGQNALFLYVGSELLKRHFPLYVRLHAPSHAQLLASHVGAVLAWLAVGIALYKRRVFVTL